MVYDQPRTVTTPRWDSTIPEITYVNTCCNATNSDIMAGATTRYVLSYPSDTASAAFPQPVPVPRRRRLTEQERRHKKVKRRMARESRRRNR